MSMLPITDSDSESTTRLVSVFAVGNAQVTPDVLRLFGIQRSSKTVSDVVVADLDSTTSFAFMHEQNIVWEVVEASDSIIHLVDATIGISPQSIEFWNKASDLDIPQLIVATNLFASHADFDEVVAIAQRVFSPDILVRYLPMANDEENQIVAQFDLLRNEIILSSSNESLSTLPDPEHLELTADQRDALIESLAYAGLSDSALTMYRNGISPSVSELERCWNSELPDSVMSLDTNSGFEQIANWLALVPARWVPVIESDDHQTHVSIPDFYGCGITSQLARYWGIVPDLVQISDGQDSNESLERLDAYSSVIISEQISSTDVLHESGHRVELVLPVFE